MLHLGLAIFCGGMFADHIVREHQASKERLASQERTVLKETHRMVGILDSDRDLLLYRTHLYNVNTCQFDEVGVLVDTGSNVVFVDSAYCADIEPCEPINVTLLQGEASYSQRGVAFIRGKQNIAFKAYAQDLRDCVYKLLLSANAATQLGLLQQPAVHRDTPTSELPELPVDKMQA